MDTEKQGNLLLTSMMLCALFFFLLVGQSETADAAHSDGFVFPVLGISQTDPQSNIVDPLSDGWTGNGVGWSGDGLVGHLGQDYYLRSG